MEFNRSLFRVWSSAWTLRSGFHARAVLLLMWGWTWESLWYRSTSSSLKALCTNMTQNFLDFREEICRYCVLCNISHWGLNWHPLITHINISEDKCMNIPTKQGKYKIESSIRSGWLYQITLDRITVAKWVTKTLLIFSCLGFGIL